LGDASKISLPKLEMLVGELEKFYTLGHVDIYGGELALLPTEYLQDLLGLFNAPINLVTNLSKLHDIFYDRKYSLSVSYDFTCRQGSDKVLENMVMLDRPLNVLTLCSPELLKIPVKDMVNIFNRIQTVESVEIKPYSRNQANDFTITKKEYEEFILAWINQPKEFVLTNEEIIESSLRGKRNAFSDDHLYITPDGLFAVLDFDENGLEYFKKLADVDEYKKWCEEEKTKVTSSFCGSCKFYGRCLTEHYRPIKSEDECDGGLGILQILETLPNIIKS